MDEIPTEIVNEWGVTVSSKDDFDIWEWGDPYPFAAGQEGESLYRAVCISAARTVLEEIQNNTMASIEWKPDGGGLLVEFGLFEYETTLSKSLDSLVKFWIEWRTNRFTNLVDSTDDIKTALAMAEYLSEMARKLRGSVTA